MRHVKSRGRWILLGGFRGFRGLHGSASLSLAKRGSGRVYMGDRVVYMGLKVFYMGEEQSPYVKRVFPHVNWFKLGLGAIPHVNLHLHAASHLKVN